jgi:pilus assembly protein CpaD
MMRCDKETIMLIANLSKSVLRGITAGGLLGLAACASNSVNPPQLGVATDKVLSATVQRLTHDIRMDPAGRLSAVEARSLQDFLTAVRVGYGDDISLENPMALAGAAQSIAPIVSRFGLTLATAAAPTGAAIQPGTVRLVVSRSLVQLPACPDWSRHANTNFNNASLDNFGCATRTNLGLMIADPADLERGRALDGVDAKTITRGLEWLRTYKSKGFEGLPAGGATGSGSESGGGSE